MVKLVIFYLLLLSSESTAFHTPRGNVKIQTERTAMLTIQEKESLRGPLHLQDLTHLHHIKLCNMYLYLLRYDEQLDEQQAANIEVLESYLLMEEEDDTSVRFDKIPTKLKIKMLNKSQSLRVCDKLAGNIYIGHLKDVDVLGKLLLRCAFIYNHNYHDDQQPKDEVLSLALGCVRRLKKSKMRELVTNKVFIQCCRSSALLFGEKGNQSEGQLRDIKGEMSKLLYILSRFLRGESNSNSSSLLDANSLELGNIKTFASGAMAVDLTYDENLIDQLIGLHVVISNSHLSMDDGNLGQRLSCLNFIYGYCNHQKESGNNISEEHIDGLNDVVDELIEESSGIITPQAVRLIRNICSSGIYTGNRHVSLVDTMSSIELTEFLYSEARNTDQLLDSVGYQFVVRALTKLVTEFQENKNRLSSKSCTVVLWSCTKLWSKSRVVNRDSQKWFGIIDALLTMLIEQDKGYNSKDITQILYSLACLSKNGFSLSRPVKVTMLRRASNVDLHNISSLDVSIICWSLANLASSYDGYYNGDDPEVRELMSSIVFKTVGSGSHAAEALERCDVRQASTVILSLTKLVKHNVLSLKNCETQRSVLEDVYSLLNEVMIENIQDVSSERLGQVLNANHKVGLSASGQILNVYMKEKLGLIGVTSNMEI